MRLVELEGDGPEHDWCVTGHVGYVLQGELEIAGAGERHRPRAVSRRVVLLLVEDV